MTNSAAQEAAQQVALDLIRRRAKDRRKQQRACQAAWGAATVTLVPDAQEQHADVAAGLPALLPRPLQRAFAAAARRPLAGTYLVRTEAISDGRGMATGAVLRRSLVDPNGGSVIASVVEKVLRARARGIEGRVAWYNEALFYASGLEEHVRGVRIPSCFEIYVAGPGQIRLYLQDLDEFQQPRRARERYGVARGLGLFGASATGAIAGEHQWLELASDHRDFMKTPPSTQTVREWVTSGEAGALICDGFAKLRCNALTLSRLRGGLYPTLTHGDTHIANVLVDEAKGDVFLVDWARVSVGHLGQDLAMLTAPFRAIIIEGMRYETYRDYERGMMGEYIEGLRLSGKTFDIRVVRTAYNLALLDYCSSRLAQAGLMQDRIRKLSSAAANRRREALQAFLLDIASRARSLADA